MTNTRMQFEDGGRSQSRQSTKQSSFVTFLIKRGFAKNETQANYILLGISVVCALVMIFMFSGGEDSDKPLTPTEQILIEEAGSENERLEYDI